MSGDRRGSVANPSPLLEVAGLSVSYRGESGTRRPVLHGIDLTVAAGELVAIVGESGSGKSTLAHAVLGLLPSGGHIDGGTVRLGRRDLVGLTPRQMRGVRGKEIGLVPQDPMMSLDPVLRIGGQVGESLRIHGRASAEAAAARSVELLAAAGIHDPERVAAQYPHELSGGMRQRALIASALACDPRLVIADEPTSALDVTVQAKILDQIQTAVRERGTAVLLITHDLAVAVERADRVVVMQGGRVVETGTPRQIVDAAREDYTRRLLASAPSMTGRRLVSAPRAPAIAPVLVADALHKTFRTRGRSGPGTITAVHGFSLEVHPGETVAIVGESGSGKSTAARMLLAMERPDSGSVRWDGAEITGLSGRALRSLRPGYQMVYQSPFASLNPRMTVGDLIAEPMRINRVGRRAERRDRVGELLDRVSLPRSAAARRSRELSGGQRQRVAIARALALRPKVLVCDEPVSALDASVQAQVLDLLVRLQQESDLAYVFISHDLAVVRQIAHRVCVMRLGKVVESGETGSILAHPKDPYTRELLQAVPGATARPM